MQRLSKCLKVSKTIGEKTLRIANRLGITDKTLQIQQDQNGVLCIPIVREPDENENELLKTQISELLIASSIFPERKRRGKTVGQALAGVLPIDLTEKAPRSLDIVGDIAVVEIPAELEQYGKLLGEAILETHKNLKVVLAKAGAISGTYRLRNFEFIAGEQRTRTIYKENGCKYHVDLAKAYFSPRLSHEHQRIASQAQEGETVVDLFAGVGPFAILIAKNLEKVKVYALDINVEAVKLLKENILLNKVRKKVYALTGDARKLVATKFIGMADRVIMNLPERSKEFIDVACKAIKPSGGIINYYGFVRLSENIEDLTLQFAQNVENSGRKIKKILCSKTVRETAPYECQAVLDAWIC
jgi:tRNA (guanine37-N1)-methyltransferase